VLAWKGEGQCHTGGFEYLTVFVKAIESILELDEVILSESITSDNVTEIQERTECAHHVLRNMALDCRQVDLDI